MQEYQANNNKIRGGMCNIPTLSQALKILKSKLVIDRRKLNLFIRKTVSLFIGSIES